MSTIDRRALLQRALLLAGATLAPCFSVEALTQSPRLLDEPRFRLLSAVADTIVPRTDTPGAVDVEVPRLFDGLLRQWASPSRRAQLIAALDAVNAYAVAQGKKGFTDLPADERLALLSAHDAAALRPPTSASSAPDPGYAKLKELIVVLYYYSEPGATKELVYEHAPGEWKPSIPITPETRASAGTALI